MRPFALPTVLFAAGTLAQSTKDVKCADGLYMIVARGTSEEKGTGITGDIAKDIAKRVNGSIIEPLDYPATFKNYEDSESDGVKAMTSVLTTYHKSCPDGKIAVFGYSQGGQIATDTFCGGAGGDFSSNKPISTDLVQDSVVAIIVFGDPSHVANASYNLGSSKNDGVFERDDIKLCEDDYSDIIRSYCDKGDVYCDKGDDEDVHGGYVSKYGDDVADFVVKQYESAASGKESTTTATSTAAEATATGSSTATAAETTSESASVTPTSAPGNAAASLVPGLALAIAPLALAISQLLL
ncbi:hypothetical protein FSARC_7393 [Fusarium sarcochroum]|uniref:Acetylxylan esterase n=1 Tax=Fusarium sarcochroum TaxID=1208366 RepID=A0A8H4TV39_9HYPO|nr:hypothetical protein FSARC_7393 [Fusarium sarcochroum]